MNSSRKKSVANIPDEYPDNVLKEVMSRTSLKEANYPLTREELCNIVNMYFEGNDALSKVPQLCNLPCEVMTE
ncbi:hypothetical protein Ciccas_001214 [Cichlidogyrus casuarinus]|uniref:Uncharacterized protein n=1 Tax=Cichlidogyrus casuarinus TaxID=1844966 RepID=A0ABD2QKP6_9PLAT